ncbi:MAG: TVP38/TMEM64 family protein [Planctomycetota bacterium]
MLRALLLAALVAGSLLAVHALPWSRLTGLHDLSALSERIESFGAAGPPALVLLGAVAIGFGMPRLLVAGVGGLCFGWLLGAVLAELAALLGALLTLGWVRVCDRGSVARLLGPRAERLLQLVEARPVALGALLRLFPLGYGFATNLLFGLSRTRVAPFLLGALLGTLPSTLFGALSGGSLRPGAAGLLPVALGLLASGTIAYALWLGRGGLARLESSVPTTSTSTASPAATTPASSAPEP